MSVVFVDTETTGLDPARHEVFEVALLSSEGHEAQFWLPVDLRSADPTALRMTRYYQRHPRETSPGGIGADAYERRFQDIPIGWKPTSFGAVVERIVAATAGQHLVGAVPSFDATFLDVLIRQHGLVPAWHYHLVDVEALVAGKLGIAPPWDSEELAEKIDVKTPEGAERHTALADARWAKALYEAVMS